MADKIRKLVDIDREDLVWLAALAARRGESVKRMIEIFLHTLAIQAQHDEVVHAFEKTKDSSSGSEEKRTE